jgi:hypothetical protein
VALTGVTVMTALVPAPPRLAAPMPTDLREAVTANRAAAVTEWVPGLREVLPGNGGVTATDVDLWAFIAERRARSGFDGDPAAGGELLELLIGVLQQTGEAGPDDWTPERAAVARAFIVGVGRIAPGLLQRALISAVEAPTLAEIARRALEPSLRQRLDAAAGTLDRASRGRILRRLAAFVRDTVIISDTVGPLQFPLETLYRGIGTRLDAALLLAELWRQILPVYTLSVPLQGGRPLVCALVPDPQGVRLLAVDVVAGVPLLGRDGDWLDLIGAALGEPGATLHPDLAPHLPYAPALPLLATGGAADILADPLRLTVLADLIASRAGPVADRQGLPRPPPEPAAGPNPFSALGELGLAPAATRRPGVDIEPGAVLTSAIVAEIRRRAAALGIEPPGQPRRAPPPLPCVPAAGPGPGAADLGADRAARHADRRATMERSGDGRPACCAVGRWPSTGPARRRRPLRKPFTNAGVPTRSPT